MNPLILFDPSGSELAGAGGDSVAALLECGTESRVTGDSRRTDHGELDSDLLGKLAWEATNQAFLEASSTPCGATVIRDGWICRVKGDRIVEKIKRAPVPEVLPDGALSFRP